MLHLSHHVISLCVWDLASMEQNQCRHIRVVSCVACHLALDADQAVLGCSHRAQPLEDAAMHSARI